METSCLHHNLKPELDTKYRFVMRTWCFCYRLGTLAYTQSFEVGLKVTALRGSRVVDSNLRSRRSLEP